MNEISLIKKGKVRDLYEIDSNHLLIVASDRISAFDVILPNTIPNKGVILTEISNFWFNKTKHIISNHLQNLDLTLTSEVIDAISKITTQDNYIIARHLKPIPIEAIVRGYLVGSAWREYSLTNTIAGMKFPKGLEFGSKLETSVFTPSTKAPEGEHDVNINYNNMIRLLGMDLADKIINVSFTLYKEATKYALEKGIIIADTKFEFGLDQTSGELILMDELLTPDSSRFWDASKYHLGKELPSMDKQILRDYLESIGWNKKTPAPELPQEVVDLIEKKYKEIKDIIIS